MQRNFFILNVLFLMFDLYFRLILIYKEFKDIL